MSTFIAEHLLELADDALAKEVQATELLEQGRKEGITVTPMGILIVCKSCRAVRLVDLPCLCEIVENYDTPDYVL